MNEQTKLVDQLQQIEEDARSVRKLLEVLDRRARAAYNKTIDNNAPNMYITSWEELSEERRNYWRDLTE